MCKLVIIRFATCSAPAEVKRLFSKILQWYNAQKYPQTKLNQTNLTQVRFWYQRYSDALGIFRKDSKPQIRFFPFPLWSHCLLITCPSIISFTCALLTFYHLCVFWPPLPIRLLALPCPHSCPSVGGLLTLIVFYCQTLTTFWNTFFEIAMYGLFVV